ncbi:hypothetical protein ACNKHK_02470 [Shigella flexneri]
MQNELQLAMPLLPQEVQQQGVYVREVIQQLPDGCRCYQHQRHHDAGGYLDYVAPT